MALAKSPNKHNRLYGMAAPLNENILHALAIIRDFE